MTKIAWKVINGYGPYAYLQHTRTRPGASPVSDHVKYLGKPGEWALPGDVYIWEGVEVRVPKLALRDVGQLRPSARADIKPHWLQSLAGGSTHRNRYRKRQVQPEGDGPTGTFRLLRDSHLDVTYRLPFRQVRHIVRDHPRMKDNIDLLIAAVTQPDEIWQNPRLPTHLTYLKAVRKPGFPTRAIRVHAILDHSENEFFILTAFPIDRQGMNRARRGNLLWHVNR